MGELRNKSEMNGKAALLLKDKELYAPSIHCLYYSCLQRSKATLFESLGVDQRELDIEYNEKKSKKKSSGSHNIIINRIFSSLMSSQKGRLARDYKNWIFALKSLREDADYFEVPIIEDDCLKAVRSTDKIIDIFNKEY